MFRHMRLRPFRRDRNGSVTIIAAFTFVVIMVLVGGLIDFSIAVSNRLRLQDIADSAILVATTPSEMLNTSTTAQQDVNTTWGLSTASMTNVSNLTATINVVDTTAASGGKQRSVTLTFSGQSTTFFGSLLGYNSIKVGGTSTAARSTAPYINIYVLIDNSQSMGIGSTQADMISLYNVSQKKNNDGCVFGCHVALSGEPYSDEALAHANSVTLRIDSAKSATTTMINQASADNESNYVKFALYTMGGGDSASSTLLNKVADVSNNYTSLITSVSTIDLETKSAQGVIGDTDFEDALAALVAKLPATNGDGNTAATPMNFIFIVTDGLDDFDVYKSGLPCLNNAPSPGGYRCTQPMPVSNCTTAKKSANVGVIYTPYLPLYTNPNYPGQGYYSSYTSLVSPFSSTISSNLQNCATNSNFFFTASDGPSIVTAMTQLFARASSYARLTS